MDEAARFSALIGSLYDAALDPARWREALAGARDFIGGATAGIVIKDTAANRGAVCYDDGGVDAEYTGLYFSKYVTLDPLTTGHFFSTVETPVSTTDILPYDAFAETRFYKEWVEPQDFVDCIGAAIDKTAATAVIFNVMRRKPDGMFDEEARRRTRLVAPHVRRAALIGKAADQKTAESDSFADALDGLSAAMFMTDEGGRIVHANAAGRTILAQGDFLYAAGGRLVARNSQTNHSLREVLSATQGGDAAVGVKGIGLPFVGRDGGSHVAHVLPLTSGARRGAGRTHAATAAIFVHKAALDTTSPPETIARHYRLTPSELRVLLGIVEVGGVPEVAEALGVADTTVKTHLGRLYEKTGTGRQADLVKLVAGFSNPLVH